MHLAQALIADALGKEWGVTEEERDSTEKPWWTRRLNFVPCDCETCFHCKHDCTTAIASPTPSQEQLSSAKKRKPSGGAATTPAPAADTRKDHTWVEISPDKA
jgi:hypothetical protein